MFVIERRFSDVRSCFLICTVRTSLMRQSVPACVCVLLESSLRVCHLVVQPLMRASTHAAACVVSGPLFEVQGRLLQEAHVQRVPQRDWTCMMFFYVVNRRCVV